MGLLQRARRDQTDPEWAERYRTDRPVVERKIAHLVRRPRERIATDVDTRAGAVNLARLAALGLAFVDGSWVVATA